MKRILFGVLIFIGVAFAAIATLPFLIPASTYGAVLKENLEAATGRTVTLSSDPKVKFFPRLGADIEGVEISNADGFSDPHFLKADQLSASVKWLPLLSRRIEVDQLTFSGADIRLEQKADGSNNWTFDTASEDEATTDAGTEGAAAFEASIPDARITNGRVVFTDRTNDVSYDLSDINVRASLRGMNAPATVQGSLELNGEPVEFGLSAASIAGLSSAKPVSVTATLDTRMAEASYDGKLQTGDAVAFDGSFDGDVRQLQDLLTWLNVNDGEDTPDLNALGRIRGNGRLVGALDNLSINDLSFSQSSDLMTSDYNGSARMRGETVSLDGDAQLKIDSLGNLAQWLPLEGGTQDLAGLGRAELQTSIKGALDNLSLTDFSFEQDGRDLSSKFEGSVQIVGDKVQPVGQFSASSDNLKRLASAFDIALEGADSSAYRTFEVDARIEKGDATLGADAIRAKLTTTLDDIRVTGDAGISLSGQTPKVRLDLAIPKLDVSPYLQNAGDTPDTTSEPEGWSEDPLDLSALKAINGSFDLRIDDLTDGRAQLLDVVLDATLQNGRLVGDLYSREPEGGRLGSSQFIAPLYNGNLTTKFDIRTSNTERIDVDLRANGSGIAASALVKMGTGLDALRGVGSFDDVSIITHGTSMADFIRNMTGRYDATVSDGALRGVNLAQLLRSARSALETRELPAALSPEAETDFTSLKLDGNINGGKANIIVFSLRSPFVTAEATGTIDLFNRTLDIRFQPKATNTRQAEAEGIGIQGFGIPLRIQGSWTNVSAGLDIDYLSTLAQQAVRSRVQSEVEDRLGDALGDELGSALGGVLGNAIGGGRQQPAQSPQEEPTEKTDEETQEDDRDPVEDAAEELIRDLFGRRG